MGFKESTEEAERQHAEEKAEEFEQGGDQEPIVRLTKGMNVFWVLPRVDSMPSWRMLKNMHYAPFHACGRKDPIRDYENDDQDWKRDNFFGNCYRCGNAWDTYEGNDKPKQGDKYDKFLDDMADEQTAFNAVDLSSFFKVDGNGYAEPQPDVIERWGETFVEVMRGEIEPPEDMPEDMAEQAQASPSPVLVSTDKVGEPLENEVNDKKMRTGEDPLLDPNSQLVEIHKEYTGETFSSRGQEQRKCKYTIRFTLDPKMEDFELPQGAVEAAEEQATDLNDPSYEPQEAEEDSLVEKARALVKLSDEEMEQYLDLSDHSFHVNSGDGAGEEEGGDGDEQFSDDDDAMSAEQKSKVDEMKNKMHGE